MKKYLVIGLLLLSVGCKKVVPKGNFDIIYDTTYVGDEGTACLTFHKDGYSLYDCDSEPTNYFFDSENECTYIYNKDTMRFKCEYNNGGNIKILNWTKEEFKFKYKNEIKIFKAK